MKKCIYCFANFQQASKEHIMQNSLGARWKTNEIVCQTCQDYFGQSIDVALNENIQPIRVLFGTEGGRGGSPGRIIADKGTGKEMFVLPGGKPKLREPVVSVTPHQGIGYKIKAQLDNTTSHIGWAINKIKNQLPKGYLTKEKEKAFIQKAQQTQKSNNYLRGSSQIELGIGGKNFFRGALKAVFNLIAASRHHGPSIVLCDEFNSLREFIRYGTGNSQEYARWPLEDIEIPFELVGTLDHTIFVNLEGKKNIGCFIFFGHIPFLFKLTENYKGHPFFAGYTINPFRNTDPAEKIYGTVTKEFNISLSNTLMEPSSKVWPVMEKRINRLLHIFYNGDSTFSGAWRQSLRKEIESILAPYRGQTFTHALASKLVNDLQPYLYHRFSRKFNF